MTPPEPNIRISASAFRQLLTAAADAGLASLISASSVRLNDDEVVITISQRNVRALTNWLTIIAERHRDAPIIAAPIPNPTSTDVVGGIDESWMLEVFDDTRSTPVGYERARIPNSSINKKDNS